MRQGLQRSGFSGTQSPRDRAVSAALSLLMLALFAIAIIRMGYFDNLPPVFGEHLTAITLHNESSAASASKAAPKQPLPQVPKTVPVPTPVPPPQITIPNEKAPPVNFIHMSSEDMASADIGKMHGQGAGEGTGNAKEDYGPGEGPGGQHLYKAEWYREPSRAELAGYLSERNAGAEWAMIACKTIEHYHVENCQMLGESPPGSGLARAMREASWQFLVIPPRINGKPQVGAWVRIRFDFLHGTAR